MSTPSGPVHLHIGRLVIDATLLEGGVAPHDLQARLQAALAPQLVRPDASGRASSNWLDATAGAIETRVRGALSGAEA